MSWLNLCRMVVPHCFQIFVYANSCEKLLQDFLFFCILFIHFFNISSTFFAFLKFPHLPFGCQNSSFWQMSLSQVSLKGPYADHILIPQGSTGSSIFIWYQMKAHIFLIANPNFSFKFLCSFGDITKSVKLIGIPENNFLCIFIIASSPGCILSFASGE